ncbi:MAG: zinc-binding alcohol dehydrogenase [Ruminococcaceae bacterium]|nr:zinc-binding alcohol dehydrogenase [Oscillospiraceae bacterium]
MKTRQIVFTKPYTAELLEVECPAPQKDELCVRIEFSAISSGTERANYVGDRNRTTAAEDEEATFPRTVGYSAAGVITELGEEITDLCVGDRVIVYWGSHQRNITVKRTNVVKIPDNVSLQEASMALIATFPLGAIRKTRLEIGESALVMGLGILGIFAVQELRAAGAYPVIAADPVKERRELALKMGADFALDPTADDFAQTVKQLSDGGVNVCIEVTGLGVGLVQALDCMKRMGRVALLGCTRSSHFEIDYYGKVHGPGISLIGAHTMARPKTESSGGLWTDEDDIKTLLRLIGGNRLNFKDMIFEIHAPTEAQTVYDRLAKDKSFPIGVLFDWKTI